MTPALSDIITPEDVIVRRMVALFDYDPWESSPNYDSEVSSAERLKLILLFLTFKPLNPKFSSVIKLFSLFSLEVELGFRSGDIIYVLGDMDRDGFYFVSVTFTIKTQHLLRRSPTYLIFILFQGDLHGRRGLVPSNYLQLLPWD